MVGEARTVKLKLSMVEGRVKPMGAPEPINFELARLRRDVAQLERDVEALRTAMLKLLAVMEALNTRVAVIDVAIHNH